MNEYKHDYSSDDEANLRATEADKRHTGKNKEVIKIITIIIVILFVTLSILAIFGGVVLNMIFGGKVKGSGVVITEERELEPFKKVEVSGVFKVNIKMKDKQNVEVIADDNVIPLIITEVKDDTLYVYMDKPVERCKRLEINLDVVSLDKLSISGAAEVDLNGLANDNFEVNLSGAGDVDLENITTKQMKVDSSGASSVKVNGETEEFYVEISGAGSIKAEKFYAKDVKVSISGAGNCKVFASDKLEASVSGVGNVVYYGDPGTVNKSVSGVGVVKKGQ